MNTKRSFIYSYGFEYNNNPALHRACQTEDGDVGRDKRADQGGDTKRREGSTNRRVSCLIQVPQGSVQENRAEDLQDQDSVHPTMRTKCEECCGAIVKKDVEFSLYEESLGKFPAQVCTKCGEKVFDEQTSDKIDEIAKQKGLWGLEAKAKVTRVGSSIAVVINKRLAEFLLVKQGREVLVHPLDKKRLVVEF